MSETIPDEVMKAAERIATTYALLKPHQHEHLRNDIVSALLARDERAAKEMAEIKEERDHLLEIGSKAVKFQLGDLFVESRGLGVWAVSNGHAVWNTFGEWEIEPSPSNRGNEFLARTRYGFAEAWEIASAIRDRSK